MENFRYSIRPLSLDWILKFLLVLPKDFSKTASLLKIKD